MKKANLEVLVNPISNSIDIMRVHRNKNFGSNYSTDFTKYKVVIHAPTKKLVDEAGKSNIDVVIQTEISKPYNDFYGHGFNRRYKAKYSVLMPYDMAEAIYGSLYTTGFPLPIK